MTAARAEAIIHHQSLNERALSENWNYVMISVCGVRVVARAGEGGDSTAGSVFSVVSRRLDRRRLARRGCRHPAVTLYHLQPGRCPAHHHTTTTTTMCQCGAQPGPGAGLLVVVAGESCPMFPGEECSPAPGSSTCTPRGHHTTAGRICAAPIDPEYGNYYPGSQ